MSGELKILCCWLLFGGTHILGSAAAVRAFLIRRLTLGGFKALYSAVALATFVPLVLTYAENEHAGASLFMPPTGSGSLAQGLMQLSLIVLVQGLVTVNPLTTLAEMSGSLGSGARGIQRVTRHPQILAFVLFGVAHVMVNPFVADWIFFGGFVLYGLFAAAHQDARMRATGSVEAKSLLKETSAIPFAGILAGRQRLAIGEFSFLGFVLAVVLFVALRHFHGALFGGVVG